MMNTTREPFTSFMFTFSGRRVDLPQPQPGQIHIDDVAVHLARLMRYCGATTHPRSVAAHSMHVASLALQAGAPAEVQLAALLHDAHEAFSGDQTSPWKRAVGKIAADMGMPCPMRLAELTLQREVLTQLGVWHAFDTARASIHHWDMVSLVTERRDLAPAESQDQVWASTAHIAPDPAPIMPLRGMAWRDTADDFLDVYESLNFQIASAAIVASQIPAPTTTTTSETTTKP